MYDGNPGEIDFGSSQREVRVIGSQLYIDGIHVHVYCPSIQSQPRFQVKAWQPSYSSKSGMNKLKKWMTTVFTMISEDEIAEFLTETEREKNARIRQKMWARRMSSTFRGVSARKKHRILFLKPCRETGKCFKDRR